MKKIALIAALLFASTAAVAETPNPTTMGWKAFAEASGCVFVDKGGYSNIALAADPTDPCPREVFAAFWGEGFDKDLPVEEDN